MSTTRVASQLSLPIKCQDWRAIQSALEKLLNNEPYRWIFRGVRNVRWNLQPGIERQYADTLRKENPPYTLIEVENQLLFDFKSKACLYSDRLPAQDDIVGWLSWMQHHRMPTRLLDWTYSPYVGLFFAVEEDASASDTAVVWAIDRMAVEEASKQASNELFGIAEPNFTDPSCLTSLAFPPAFDPPDKSRRGLVVHLLPSFQNMRLSAQQGTFLFNCNYSLMFEKSLCEMMKNRREGWLKRIEFPRKLRLEILARLFYFNVHPASLFPDLDGAARFLSLKEYLRRRGKS